MSDFRRWGESADGHVVWVATHELRCHTCDTVISEGEMHTTTGERSRRLNLPVCQVCRPIEFIGRWAS